MIWSRDPGSFRDPAGFVFTREGVVYRQVSASFAANYDRLMQSGLYEALAAARLLVPHQEVDLRLDRLPRPHRVIQPERVPFISYPYEWCFGQLKAAALLTLDVQRRAVARGCVLRDASAYNVQFVDGRPILIDTLSFGEYAEGQPWVAYRQFCQHFLAPLALMSRVDSSLGLLLRVHIDGVPLRLASRTLPASSWFRAGLLTHLHLHSRSIDRHAQGRAIREHSSPSRGMSRSGLLGLLDHLARTVDGLRYDPAGGVWARYYDDRPSYSAAAAERKRHVVGELMSVAERYVPEPTVWDLGANTGVFSRIAAARARLVVSLDADHDAVESNYDACVKERATRVLPLVQDITNPSGGVGWRGRERRSLLERGPADVVLALALVHHLAIASNVPLDEIAAWLRQTAPIAVIEFVPKADPQVQRMLAVREDVFDGYDDQGFEAAMRRHFVIVRREHVDDSRRTIYLLEGR